MYSLLKQLWNDKQSQVVLFSSTAIALYGYDQGMMSLVNTNSDYLATMGISGDDALVGVIVSVYYLGCTVGAIMASALADRLGRKASILACIITASLGSLICFMAGMGYSRGSMAVMLLGRVVMGLGVGGIDSVVPLYSAELSRDEARGKALAIQFQFNILGLNLAFALNLVMTRTRSSWDQWSWRVPIIAMNAFCIALLAIIQSLPESPRFLVFHGREEDATRALQRLYPQSEESKNQLENLVKISDEQKGSPRIGYVEMLAQPGSPQFHPTMIVILGQVLQAMTGYGFVSVYGSQCVMLLGFGKDESENIIQANYISYLILMTFAWLLIDAVGRRPIMLWNSAGLIVNFVLLALFGALAEHTKGTTTQQMAFSVLGCVALFIATGCFGVGWLVPPWLIPTEIYETRARAKGTAISVIIWGLSNFAITLLSPVLFNNFKYWIFFIFAVTNAAAAWITLRYIPESGGRSFEDNQEFFQEAKEANTWRVKKVRGGEFLKMPYGRDEEGEETPLLRRVQQQYTGETPSRAQSQAPSQSSSTVGRRKNRNVDNN